MSAGGGAACRQRAGDPELRRAQLEVRRREPLLLRRMGQQELVERPLAGAAPAHRPDADRRRDRLRDRDGARARRASLPRDRAPDAARDDVPLHDPLAGAVRAARRAGRPEHLRRRDRARLLHAADPLPQHPDRPARGPARGARRRRRDGHDAPPGAAARRAAARAAGDRRRPADRRRDDHRARDDRLSDLPARARRADPRARSARARSRPS